MQYDLHIWSLLGRKLAQEATEKERMELDKILIEDPDINNLIRILSIVWYEPDEKNPAEIERAFIRVLQRVKEQRI